MKPPSSKRLAQNWENHWDTILSFPAENQVMSRVFPRHKAFEREMRKAASAWFEEKGFPVHSRMAYCLAGWEGGVEHIKQSGRHDDWVGEFERKYGVG